MGRDIGLVTQTPMTFGTTTISEEFSSIVQPLDYREYSTRDVIGWWRVGCYMKYSITLRVPHCPNSINACQSVSERV
jgi:hypothetical protein